MIKFSFIVCLLVACTKTSFESSNKPEDCSLAEAHLKALNCIPQGYYTKDKNFTQFCQAEIGNNISMYPLCLAKISSCEQVNECLQSDNEEKK